MRPGEEWLGLEFGEALAKARPFRVLLTKPGYRCLGKGRLLVVGQRQESEGLTLLLSYTEFERLPKAQDCPNPKCSVGQLGPQPNERQPLRGLAEEHKI